MSINHIGFVKFPSHIYNALKEKRAGAIFDKQNHIIRVIDLQTNEIITELIEEKDHIQSEFAFLEGSTISMSLPIDFQFKNDLQYTSSRDRPKCKTLKKNAEILDISTPVKKTKKPSHQKSKQIPEPVANINDVAPINLLLCLKIDAVLDFLTTIDDEEIQLSTLQDLLSFLISETRTGLSYSKNPHRSKLISARKSKDIDYIKQLLIQAKSYL